jgi:hypothetical protein
VGGAMIQDPHFGFVVAAYALGFVIVGGMILAILLDYFTLKRALSQFASRPERQDAKRAESQRESLD